MESDVPLVGTNYHGRRLGRVRLCNILGRGAGVSATRATDGRNTRQNPRENRTAARRHADINSTVIFRLIAI